MEKRIPLDIDDEERKQFEVKINICNLLIECFQWMDKIHICTLYSAKVHMHLQYFQGTCFQSIKMNYILVSLIQTHIWYSIISTHIWPRITTSISVYQIIDNIILILDWNDTKTFNEKLQTMIGLWRNVAHKNQVTFNKSTFKQFIKI